MGSRRSAPARPWGLVGALAVWLVAGTASSGFAAVFAVTSPADAVDAAPGNGVCATAGGVCTVRAAIQEANALAGPDAITIPGGFYALALPGNDDTAAAGDLDVNDALTITGAGALATTLSGAGLDRVLDVRAATSISGVTVRDGSSGGQAGGGIRNSSPLSLTDAVVTQNQNTDDGGGIASDGAASSLTLLRVDVTDNQADKGAGLFVKDAPLGATLTDVRIEANVASKDGGGAHLDEAPVALLRVQVLENEGEKGAGLYIKKEESVVTAVDSVVRANVASKEGGGVYNDDGDVSIERSTLSANTTAKHGGGIFSKGGKTRLALVNVTISGNVAADEGGGLRNDGGGSVVDFTNVTVSGNSASKGGGLRVKNGTVRLLNTIVANSPSGGNCNGSPSSLGQNLDSANTCAFTGPGDLTNSNPLLGALQNNGGLTETHALAFGSPAIDAAAGCPGSDQRGFARPFDGDGDGAAVCDIGAYEFREVPDLLVLKAVTPVEDPINGLANPLAIPGATVVYTIQVTNTGLGPVELDTLIVTDPVPADLTLRVADFAVPTPGPVRFTDGATTSGLTYTFVGLADAGDDIEFSNDGGASWGYTPVPDANGLDANVTDLRVNPKGIFAGAGAGNPSFLLEFKAVVK